MVNVNDIKIQLKLEIDLLKSLVEKCEKEGLTNEQFYLEFENEINALSVKDHNK